MATSPLLIVRTQQLQALRPALEQQFVERVAHWISAWQGEAGAPVARQALEARVAACIDHARSLGFERKRDIARFVALDFEHGGGADGPPRMAWIGELLRQRGLSPATRLHRIDCRLKRLADLAAEAAEPPDAADGAAADAADAAEFTGRRPSAAPVHPDHGVHDA